MTDLSITGPADGYILAGACRVLRPDSLILLLTGLPDLEGAWNAIQESVNRLLLKPVDPFELNHLAASIVVSGTSERKRLNLGELIAAHEDEIVEDWYAHVEADPAVAVIPMEKEDRLDDLRPILATIEHRVQHPADALTPEQAHAARSHGIHRKTHGYPIMALLREASHLRQSVTRLVTSHFLDLDPRHALADLFEMHAGIDENMALSLEAYLRE